MGGSSSKPSHHHYHPDAASIRAAEQAQDAARLAQQQAEENRRLFEEQQRATEKMLQEQAAARAQAAEEARKAQERYQQEMAEARRSHQAAQEEAARRMEEQRRQAAEAAERARQEQVAAARRLQEEQERSAREAEEAAQRLEEERRAAEERVAQELQRERERVHAEKLQQWQDLNRDYPVPEYLAEYVTGVCETVEDDAKQDRFINVAVIGNSGVGKSSLIKAILEHFHATIEAGQQPSPTACCEGDGTCAPTPYKLGSHGDKVRVWDLPGQGTAMFPAKTYLKNMGLKYFDAALVVTSGRLSENDVHLLDAIKFAQIWVCVVRTKVDQAVEDSKEDHDPPLDQEQVLSLIRKRLAEQLDESDENTSRIHLVTVRKKYWIGAHGNLKFGTIDGLCEQVAGRVETGQAWLMVGGDGGDEDPQ